MECRRCGKCCHFRQRLPCGDYVRTRCTHLNEDNLCDTYESRPQTCRHHTCPKLLAVEFREVVDHKQRAELLKIMQDKMGVSNG